MSTTELDALRARVVELQDAVDAATPKLMRLVAIEKAVAAWAAVDDAFSNDDDGDRVAAFDVHDAEVAVRVAAGIAPSCGCHAKQEGT